MTEKRFTVEPTMIKECIVDNTTGEQLDTFDYTERLCEVLNELNDGKQLLKEGYEEYRKLSIQFKQRIDELIVDNTFLKNENQELEKEIEKYHKYIHDVKREEIDRIFKMSIYEIADAFEYYKERINDLERRLQE